MSKIPEGLKLRYIRVVRTAASEAVICFPQNEDDACAIVSVHYTTDPHMCMVHATFLVDTADTEPSEEERERFQEAIFTDLLATAGVHVSHWFNTHGIDSEIEMYPRPPKRRVKKARPQKATPVHPHHLHVQ